MVSLDKSNIIDEIISKGILSYTFCISRFWLVILWSILHHAITVCIPFFLIFIMSKIWFIDNATTYMQLAFVFLFIGGLLLSVAYIKDQMFNNMIVKYSSEISTASFRLLLNLPYPYIGTLPLESKYSRFVPLRNFSEIWLNEIVKPLLDLPLVIMTFCILCSLMGLAYFSFISCILLLVTFVNRYLFINKIHEQKVSDAVFHGTINDVFNNIQIITKHNKLDYFRDKILDLVEKKTADLFASNVRNSIRDNIIESLLMALYIGSLLFAVNYTLNGFIQVQSLIVIVILIWFCISPSKTSIEAVYKIPKLQELIKQFEILKRVNTSINRHKKIKLNDNFKGDVVLKSVGLNLSNTASGFVLHNINFNIKRGEILLINGPSGSGKSTILGLIAGLYTPTSGVIALDIDRTIIDKESLAERSILLSHDAFLSNETIMQNLKLVSSDVSKKDLKENIKHLGFEQFISDKSLINADLYKHKHSSNESDYFSGLICKLILAKLCKNTKNKIILIDEPFIDCVSNNFEYLSELISSIKKNNTIIICSRYNFYSPLADKVLIMGDGQVRKYFKKNENFN